MTVGARPGRIVHLIAGAQSGGNDICDIMALKRRREEEVCDRNFEKDIHKSAGAKPLFE